MIQLDRSGVVAPPEWGTRVATLPAAFWTEGARFELLALTHVDRRRGFVAFAPAALKAVRTRKGATRYEFPALWREVEAVREVISEISDGRCAWCESDASASHYGHLDHVEPKSLFPTKAYRLENLLLACQLCNVYKKDQWPAAGTFVRPDAGADPSVRFEFRENGSVVGRDAEAVETVSAIKLDRRSLRTRRKQAIAPVLACLRVALGAGVQPSVARMIVQQLLAATPYSAAVNQCVRREWERRFPAVAL